MADEINQKKSIITAGEVANYAVCPEAWVLKQQHIESFTTNPESPTSQKSSRQRLVWVEKQDQSFEFREYAQILFILLGLIVAVLFLFEHNKLLSASDKNSIEKQGVSEDKL